MSLFPRSALNFFTCNKIQSILTYLIYSVNGKEVNINYKINFPILLLFSFFIHLFVLVIPMLPDRHRYAWDSIFDEGRKKQIARDIIVNINQNNERRLTPKTLLSDRDSTASGYITKKRGDRWLNNSLIFRRPDSTSSGAKARSVKSGNEKFILTSDSEIVISLEDKRRGLEWGQGRRRFAIPDKNDVSLKNAIYYSNSGLFSFNTAKFKNYRFFRDMKDKIASNWYPPAMANAIIRGYTGDTRINAIGNRIIKVVFYINRGGDVIFLKTIQSSGMTELDESCEDAIKLAKNFGKVPNDIKGNVLMVPFIFGYYTR